MIYRKRNLDLIGQKFGYLTVIEKAEPDKHGHPMWRCECECGKESTVLQSHLLSGHTLSCGCYSKRITSEMSKRVNKRYNEYDLTGPYGIGYTLKGEPFLFDIEDYDRIRDICWFKNRRGYIIGKLNRKNVYLSRLVTNCPDTMVVDHIGGTNTLHDNRKCNLRIVTQKENSMNRATYLNSFSGHTGVLFNQATNKWHAEIRVNRKSIHLGTFESIEDAILARENAEDLYFGQFSRKNSLMQYTKNN